MASATLPSRLPWCRGPSFAHGWSPKPLLRLFNRGDPSAARAISICCRGGPSFARLVAWSAFIRAKPGDSPFSPRNTCSIKGPPRFKRRTRDLGDNHRANERARRQCEMWVRANERARRHAHATRRPRARHARRLIECGEAAEDARAARVQATCARATRGEARGRGWPCAARFAA